MAIRIAIDPLRAIIGIVDSADPNASENLDETIYAFDSHFDVIGFERL